jgi:hypothetical protein
VRGLVGELVGELPVPAEGVDRGAQFDGIGVRDGFAHLQAHGQGQFLAPLLQQLGDPQQDPAPLGGRQVRPRPGVEGAARRRDGEIDLRLPRVGDLDQGLAVARGDHGERSTVTGFGVAVDVVLRGQIESLDAAQQFLMGGVQHALFISVSSVSFGENNSRAPVEGRIRPGRRLRPYR